MQTNAHSPPPLNMHLWSHKVRYAPEGACRKEIHYFSFCLALLFAAQQLKGSDQPTITVHNGFSASSTSLEACLRLGLSPCAPHLRLQPPPPPLMSVRVCVHIWVDWKGPFMCVQEWEFRATAVTMTAEDPIEKEWSQSVQPGASETVWSRNNSRETNSGMVQSWNSMQFVAKGLLVPWL